MKIKTTIEIDPDGDIFVDIDDEEREEIEKEIKTQLEKTIKEKVESTIKEEIRKRIEDNFQEEVINYIISYLNSDEAKERMNNIARKASCRKIEEETQNIINSIRKEFTSCKEIGDSDEHTRS